MSALAVVPSDDSPTFDTHFWPIYPRHEARKDALKAWNQLPPDLQVDCIKGALLWRHNYLARERQHVPLPGTFIRGERFYDELPTPPSSGSASHVPVGPAKPLGVRGAIPPEVLEQINRIKGRR